jgi:hypothetical protein
MDGAAAARAYDAFVRAPRPQISRDALRQVIDLVWLAEGRGGPQAAPEKYLDLAYFERARSSKAAGAER